jgi:hypothetical protein
VLTQTHVEWQIRGGTIPSDGSMAAIEAAHSENAKAPWSLRDLGTVAGRTRLDRPKPWLWCGAGAVPHLTGEVQDGGRCVTIGDMATKRTEEIDERIAFEVDGVRVEEATPEEWEAVIDRAARHHLGMSAEEFRRAYAAGELDDDRSDVLAVALLLPDA